MNSQFTVRILILSPLFCFSVTACRRRRRQRTDCQTQQVTIDQCHVVAVRDQSMAAGSRACGSSFVDCAPSRLAALAGVESTDDFGPWMSRASRWCKMLPAHTQTPSFPLAITSRPLSIPPIPGSCEDVSFPRLLSLCICGQFVCFSFSFFLFLPPLAPLPSTPGNSIGHSRFCQEDASSAAASLARPPLSASSPWQLAEASAHPHQPTHSPAPPHTRPLCPTPIVHRNFSHPHLVDDAHRISPQPPRRDPPATVAW